MLARVLPETGVVLEILMGCVVRFLLALAVAGLAGCASAPPPDATNPGAGALERETGSPEASTRRLSLRLAVSPGSFGEQLLHLYLVNGEGEPRPYFVSDKLNPTQLEIRDGSGHLVEPQQDGRAISGFDSASPRPETRTLAAHSEVLLRETSFILPIKVAGSAYDFSWRPFFYARFQPGTYRVRAIWRSSRGFSGELTSNEVVVVLPVPR